MTDAQIVKGIHENDDRIWRYIYRTYRTHFFSTLRGKILAPMFSNEDWEDVFEESILTLMRKVKDDTFSVVRNGGLFCYLVEIGKGHAKNKMRKMRQLNEQEKEKIADNVHRENSNPDLTTDDKQRVQDEFLERVIDSLPSDCKIIMKQFYWDNKPMDEIASMVGLANANSAKTRKNKCMNKLREIANKLVDSNEYDEDILRAAFERVALRELLREERAIMQEAGMCRAALDIEPEDEQEDK